MDFPRIKPLKHRKKNHMNKHIWEIVKCIVASLESKDNNSHNDIFYTPSTSPSKHILIKLEKCMKIDWSKRWACILADYHMKTFDQVVYLEENKWCILP